MKLKTGLAASLLLFFTDLSYGQTVIWAENFNSYINGTTIGSDNNAPSGADWFSGGCPSCALNTSDWWEIRSGQMEARDVNNDLVFLQTENIDISGWTSVQFNILCSEQGDHDGIYLTSDICADQNNEDFADIYYRLDGGPWTKIINYLGWCGLYNSCGMHSFYGDDGSDGDCRNTDNDWESVNLQIGGLSGSTLALRMEARNSAGTEYIRFDNIVVQGFLFLPVDLIAFTGNSSGPNIQLEWITASENNNEGFEIERSINGVNFERIGFVEGAGTSLREYSYTYTDALTAENSLEEILYYRLKQIDTNGAYTYSDIIALQKAKGAKGVKSLNVYPNPANEFIRVEYGLNDDVPVQIKILDSSGREVMRTVSSLSESPLEITLHSLDPGIYFIQLHTRDILETERIIVQ